MTDEKKNDTGIPFVISETGILSPEIQRITELYTHTRGLGQVSGVIGSSVADLRNIAYSLGQDRIQDAYDNGMQKYTFPCEGEIREELLSIAKYMMKMNMRLWAAMRLLGTSAASKAGDIILDSDMKDNEDIEKFLKKNPVGVEVMGPEAG